MYELKPIYSNRASFHRKAFITIENGVKTLISYHTSVAFIKEGRATVNGHYSQTTTRHIKEFLLQEGFKADNTAQILKDYKPQ